MGPCLAINGPSSSLTTPEKVGVTLKESSICSTQCSAPSCPISHAHDKGLYLHKHPGPISPETKLFFAPCIPPPEILAAYERSQRSGFSTIDTTIWVGFYKSHRGPLFDKYCNAETSQLPFERFEVHYVEKRHGKADAENPDGKVDREKPDGKVNGEQPNGKGDAKVLDDKDGVKSIMKLGKDHPGLEYIFGFPHPTKVIREAFDRMKGEDGTWEYQEFLNAFCADFEFHAVGTGSLEIDERSMMEARISVKRIKQERRAKARTRQCK